MALLYFILYREIMIGLGMGKHSFFVVTVIITEKLRCSNSGLLICMGTVSHIFF